MIYILLCRSFFMQTWVLQLPSALLFYLSLCLLLHWSTCKYRPWIHTTGHGIRDGWFYLLWLNISNCLPNCSNFEDNEVESWLNIIFIQSSSFAVSFVCCSFIEKDELVLCHNLLPIMSATVYSNHILFHVHWQYGQTAMVVQSVTNIVRRDWFLMSSIRYNNVFCSLILVIVFQRSISC